MDLKLENTNFFERNFIEKFKNLLVENNDSIDKENYFDFNIYYDYPPIQYSNTIFTQFTNEEEREYKSYHDYFVPEYSSLNEYIKHYRYPNSSKIYIGLHLLVEMIQNVLEEMKIRYMNISITGDTYRLFKSENIDFDISSYLKNSVDININISNDNPRERRGIILCPDLASAVVNISKSVEIAKSSINPKIEVNKNIQPNEKFNLNTCKYKDVQDILKGNVTLYEDILKYREEHPFKSVDELMKLPGIGKKRFDKLKDFFEV